MKNNYLHTGNTTKKSSARARLFFRAFGVVAAVTLAGFALRAALATGPEHVSVPSGKNPIAEKYSTLVMRVYFRDRAERDRLAQELNAEEVPTTGGYLTVIGDRDLYYNQYNDRYAEKWKEYNRLARSAAVDPGCSAEPGAPPNAALPHR